MEGLPTSDSRLADDMLAQPPSARVRHLLAVAREQFAARGFDAVSIDAIARASAVSKETIYRYYPDKEALFRAALEDMGTEFSARVTAMPLADTSPEENLAHFSRAILDSTVDGGLLSAAWVAISIARIMPDFAAGLQNGQSARLEPLRALLEEIAAAEGVGGARPVPLDLAVDFGSLASESPALLMGFPGPSAAHREIVAHRVAGLFHKGILGFEDRGPDECLNACAVTAVERPSAPHIRKLLDVAAVHFLDSGYQGASLDVIGAEASVGRGTLYRHFGSKSGLFAATMRDLAHMLCDIAPPPLPAGDPDVAALAAFLEASLHVLGNSRSVTLHRTVIAEMRRDPELARDVFTIPRDPWLKPLIAWLDSLNATGRVRLRDHAWYARQALVLSLKGNRVIASGHGLADGEAARAARHAATIFLHGFTAVL
jgi:AcrR family transcriptional regulator